MRVKLQFVSNKPIVLPVHYLYSVHQLVYKLFTPAVAHKIYLDGFPYKGRKLKLFNYSRILEHGKVESGNIIFDNTITFYFSCPLQYLVGDVIKNAFVADKLDINGNELMLNTCEVVPTPVFTTDSVEIRLLSPMTVYSTFQRNGKNITHYYRPTDATFAELVRDNARRKYAATMLASGNTDVNNVVDMQLDIVPKKYDAKRDQKVLYFKNKVIECYTGQYVLTGNPKLIETTYECGIGACTSMGLGMWNFVKEITQ